MNLHLILTHYWYEQVACGFKHKEYREATARWRRLIWDKRDEIETVTFHRGYTATTRTIPVENITRGICPYEGFTKLYYIIHLNPDNRCAHVDVRPTTGQIYDIGGMYCHDCGDIIESAIEQQHREEMR